MLWSWLGSLFGSKLCLTLVGYKLKKALISELLRQTHLNWFLYRGDAKDWTWLDNWFLGEEIWFLLISIIRNLYGEHMVININCWLTLHGFGPSAAFRFQVRVCADISLITHVATLVLINDIHFHSRSFTYGEDLRTRIWRNKWLNSDLTVMSPNQSQPHNRPRKGSFLSSRKS